MNKFSFFILFFALLFLILPCVLAAQENIAYILKSPFPLSNHENAIVDLLTSEGYSVYVLDDNDVIVPEIYDVLIVAEDLNDIEGIFDNKNHKTLFLSRSAAKNSGLSQSIGITGGTETTIQDNSQFITEGFTLGDKTIYNSFQDIEYLTGCKPLNSKSLAYKSETWKSTILILNEDCLLIRDGSCNKRDVPIYQRNAFFGLIGADEWNTNSETLFLKTVEWLIIGEDGDGDGYHYETDCDDSNPALWQLLSGYIDSDNDGFGTGSLIDVCSGNELPENYSEINGDCDDSDNEKWQILDVYVDNDLDEFGSGDLIGVCSGESILEGYSDNNEDCDDSGPALWQLLSGYIDSDNDGFGTGSLIDVCSGNELPENYSEINGDCDDSDELINPSAEEIPNDLIDQNCDGLPECLEIPTQIWQEDSKHYLNLSDYCVDPDGDIVLFALNDTSEDKNITITELGTPGQGNLEFTTTENWNSEIGGSDWVVFELTDNGVDFVLTNTILLNVTPVNDAPTFKDNPGTIENITWNEDNNLTDYLNLNNYFSDVDFDILDFEVIGNHFVNITIKNGLVSFYPDEDWAGTENVVFNATDNQYSVLSNAVVLTVLEVGEPPEFGDPFCIGFNSNIDEDIEYSCELNASDEEEDNFGFSVINEENLQCNIENSQTLHYSSDLNYNGNASCTVRVEDQHGYNDYTLRVVVNGVNDAPIIQSYLPQQTTLKILEGTSQLFNINVYDPDVVYGDVLSVSWLLGGSEVGNGNSYLLFNKTRDNYNVTAFVTDGEENKTLEWDVFVGSIEDFSCQEVNGYVCSEDEICPVNGVLFGVYDSDSCCSIPCIEKPPEFLDIDRCENNTLNEKIEIEIKEPDDDEEINIGENMEIKVKVKNKFEEDMDFDVSVFLYDITEENSLEDDSESLDIEEGESENAEFEFQIEEDLDEDNTYAIFIKVIDESEDFCNEDYVIFDIEREKHEVIIKDYSVVPIKALCGDYIDVYVDVENRGRKDEDVSIVVENSELGIKEQSEEFELEEYDEKDSASKFLSVKVPENAAQGEYFLKIIADYGNGESIVEQKLILGECKKLQEETFEAETISLKEKMKKAKTEEYNGLAIIVVIVGSILILTAIFFLLTLLVKVKKY